MNYKGNPLTLDTASGVPIYRQIIDWVKICVAGGTMQAGEQLPTVRQLAVDLNVNYHTVARAYLDLEHQGIVHTLRGKGTFIADREVSEDEVSRNAKLRELITEFLAKAAEFGFSPSEVFSDLSERIPQDEKMEG
jgi:DNA-binding transcriptional regulator YhcF (GntR family)